MAWKDDDVLPKDDDDLVKAAPVDRKDASSAVKAFTAQTPGELGRCLGVCVLATVGEAG
jgi:hypothetical protein